MNAVAIEFEPVSHTYTVGGRLMPSVTTILKPLDCFERVPLATLEAARVFGQHVHIACDLSDKGVLDERALDPALWPYLVGWRRFLTESGFTVVASEQRVAHAKLQYAGTLDRRVLNRRGRPGVLDIKSGMVPRSVGAQTSGYAEAWSSMSGERFLKRYCLQLLPGSYRLQELDDPASYSLFLSCLNIYKTLNR